MPRKRTTRSPNNGTSRRRTNGGVTSIPVTTRVQAASVAPYARDLRWATPTRRRRTEVVVIDIAGRSPMASSASKEDPLRLSA